MLLNWYDQIDGLVQERPNTSADALELSLSCTNPLKFSPTQMTESQYVNCYNIMLYCFRWQ